MDSLYSVNWLWHTKIWFLESRINRLQSGKKTTNLCGSSNAVIKEAQLSNDCVCYDGY